MKNRILTRWVKKRQAELTLEREELLDQFKRTDYDKDLDKLISISGKLNGYKEVLNFINTHK